MKISKISALLAAFFMTLPLCACGNAPAVSETVTLKETAAVSDTRAEETSAEEISAEITVTDIIGREVKVKPESYERVVCIGAGALRVYAYICGADKLCGVEDIDNLTLSERPKMFDTVARPYVMAYKDEFAKLPSCGTGGPNAQTAEAEKILSCAPDIVISEYEDTDKENALQEQLGVPVITLRSGYDGVFSEDFESSLRLLGTIFGRQERAEELISYIRGETEEISSRTAGAEDQPKVYVCGLGNWGTTNHLLTSRNYRPFDIANVENAAKSLPSDGNLPIEEEKFISLGENMDMMIIDAAAVKNIAPLYKEDSAMFDVCKAWREGEVYLQMAYNAYYTNYEISLINTWFTAKAAYPALFEDIDIKRKADEVTEAFLGVKLADEIYDCASGFGGYQKIDTETFFTTQ